MEDGETILQDFSDYTLDSLECIGISLWSVSFWVLAISLIVVKRFFILKHIERYLKRTVPQRKERQRKRLQDFLNDPILMINLEQRLMKKYNEDKQKVFEYIAHMKDMADESSSSSNNMNHSNEGNGSTTLENGDDEPSKKVHDYSSKGEERLEASRLLLMGTFVVCVLLGSSPANLIYLPDSSGYNNFYHYSQQQSNSYDWKCESEMNSQLVLTCTFILIQLVDSCMIYGHAHGRSNFRRKRCTATTTTKNFCHKIITSSSSSCCLGRNSKIDISINIEDPTTIVNVHSNEGKDDLRGMRNPLHTLWIPYNRVIRIVPRLSQVMSKRVPRFLSYLTPLLI